MRSAMIALFRLGALILAAILFAIGGILAWPSPSIEPLSLSTVVRGADGDTVALRLTGDGYWREKIALEDVDPLLVQMLIAYEDKRFYQHHGVDIAAVLRAALNIVRFQEIGSGASTLTMQVVRLQHKDLRGAGLWTKIKQMLAAVRLDAKLTKQEILETYFTLAPYGGNIEGVRAGAYAWFQRHPKELTLTEQALLVALPQSPEARRPDRFPERAHSAKNRVLNRTADPLGLTQRQLTDALSERAPARIMRPPTIAPHTLDRLARYESHQTSINSEWQVIVNNLLAESVKQYPSPTNAGTIIVERRTGRVRTYAGSSGYNDIDRKGANNFLAALRSTGSTLKPLIYAKAIQLKKISRNQVFTDQALVYRDFSPTNFNQEFIGQVDLRTALVDSLNIPAVYTAQLLGASAFESEMLNVLGPDAPSPSMPGLSLATGGLYLSAEHLASLYLAFADPGTSQQIVFTEDERLRQQRPFISQDASESIIRLMAQETSPGTFHVFKTGTAHARQDAWTVMLTENHVIVVWVGTPDSTPTTWLTGRDSALPIATSIAQSLSLSPARTSQTLDVMPVPTVDQKSCEQIIVYPPDDSLLLLEAPQLEVQARQEVQWYLNGNSVGSGSTISMSPGSGAYTISAVNGECRETSSVFIELKQ